ncbi:hypothetical protein QTP70_016235 [Hemibagrus guttatus]|uniref:Ig-like domain-containing protein n=1 Tax=Hemibagrus guttatus TaxID=175788 RepID=A0AAE0UVZ8_9TELE|nr:hypothetical protein QTP70_016235 [Hemibagrus guttatus]
MLGHQKRSLSSKRVSLIPGRGWLQATSNKLLFIIGRVCQPNDSQYQCTCVDQYVWSYNNCITYNACDNLNEGTCTCISAIPSDGQVCAPKTVEGVLTNIVGNIYPGTDLKLTCNPPENNGIKWTLNGIQLQQSAKYAINNVELTVKNAGPSDSGQYSCIAIVNSLPYTIWQIITIQPYPNMQVTSDKTVECDDTTISLHCCVQGVYQVKWTDPTTCNSLSKGCISCDYKINKEECQTTEQTKQVTCQLTQPISESSYNSKTIRMYVKNQDFTCSNDAFGAGNLDAIQTANCTGDMVGYQVAQCNSSKKWNIIEDNCVLLAIQNLKDEAENLQVAGIPQFMASLSSNATSQTQNLIDSAATITTIVDILTIISNLSQTTFVSQTIMTGFFILLFGILLDSKVGVI